MKYKRIPELVDEGALLKLTLYKLQYNPNCGQPPGNHEDESQYETALNHYLIN